jgi:O-antigen/teichoic acid export membrane protein
MSAIYSLISFVIVRKNAVFAVNLRQLKDGFKFSLPLVLAALSFCVIDMSDRLILEKYVSMKDIGIYSIAYALGFSINVIIKGSYKAFEPLIFKHNGNDNFLDIFISIKNEFIAMVFITCLLVVLFSKEIIVLMFPEDYYPAHLLMPIIVLAAFAKGIYTLQALLLMVNSDTKLISKIMIIGAVINVSINLMFIEEYGSIVAALSTFVAFLTMAFIVHLKGFDYYKFSYLKEIKDYIFITLLCIVAYILYLQSSMPISLAGILIKSAVLFAVAYSILKAYGAPMLMSKKKQVS